MLPPALRAELERQARSALGSCFRLESIAPVGGGSINTALKLSGPEGSVFAKLRPAQDLAMFEAEADGLQALSRCEAWKLPSVLALGEAEGQAYLLLEWLDISPIRSEAAARKAGEALAALHRCTDTHFGWPRDNFIGRSAQLNGENDHWARFFVERRLRPQFESAAAAGYGGLLQRHGEYLCEKAAAFFLEYRPTPSLLHGDLWSGNLGVLADGRAVLFDPAVYFGDREADLAMSELFGGLPLAFYSAYRQALPLAEGFETRKTLYNLYHLLNHLNLFGRPYLSQTERMVEALANRLKR